MANHFKFEFDKEKAMRKLGINENGRVQKFIDLECLRLCDQLIPMDTGNLKKLGESATIAGTGKVRWEGPYARRLYYHPEYNFSHEKNPQAGAYWFDRMKAQHKKQILEGAKKIASMSPTE